MHKAVMGEVDDPFENYFEFSNTTVNTKNKSILFRLPKLKARIWSQVSKIPLSKNI